MEFFKHIKPLANEKDWPIWKRKIRDLLDYHEGALDVIDGKLVKPEELKEGASENAIKERKTKSDLFRKANSYAKSMIASSVTDIVYQKIMDQETAFDAWNTLKRQFEASSKDQLFKICADFFSFQWIVGEDVSMHIAKLKSLWNELNIGLKAKNENVLPDLLLICKTMHILPSSFVTFKSSWMLLKSEDRKTFDDLTVQLCSFERNFMKQESGSSVSQEALAADTKQKKFKSKPKPNLYNNTNKNKCNYCKKAGHWVKDCEKWISDGKPKKTQDVSTADVAGLMLEVEALSVEISTHPSTWWIDNGATRHVTNTDLFYMDFKKFENPSGIKSAGKEILPALGTGTVKVKNLITGKDILLNDVWYVPKLCRNLFSVLAAQDRQPKSVFKSTATECWLSNQGKLLLYGKREHGGTLFKAAMEPVIIKDNPEVNNVDMLQLFHERWGHQDKRHVQMKMQKELHIQVAKEEKQLCEPCIYGKAHRLPFGHRDKSTKPGELLSADVCGPFPESFSKKKYLVVFKDNYTKYRYGYLMTEKSEVKEMLKKVLQHARMLGHKIREIISDNGGEMDNKDIREILSKAGVTQRLTAPYTPQQNAICERDFRTIIEMARTFKYSNENVIFPEAMWAELVTTSLYILNRTGKSSVEGVSPYELWMGKKPRIKHLRIIGSMCYAHIPDQKRKKMDKKSIKGYLIGYDGDERYRIWVKEENKIILSRDVLFQEKLSQCEYVKLPIEDIEVQDQGKQVDQEMPDEKEGIAEEGSIDDESESEESSDSEQSTEVESTEDKRENSVSKFSRNLRDRSKLSKPAHLGDYVTFGEEAVFLVTTPETYEKALNGNDKEHWREAMNNEIKSLKENHTWELTNLPKGSRVLPSKWVFKIKLNSDGSVDKYKARLVIKGFNQKYGVDFNETFSPVAKLSTIRAMLSIAATENMHLIQFDVSTAFLYGYLEEDIYMEQPEGYTDGTKKVCKLLRSLYGLKQAPRCWNKRFSNYLKAAGFRTSEADPCLYIRGSQNEKLIIALFVDDGLVMANNSEEAEYFIKELKKEFKITVKPASYFLGFEIERSQDGSIKICQQAYARKLLERFNFSECKPVSTPMIKLEDQQEHDSDKNHNFPYREAVGALMYLMVSTRPDLAYSVSVLSRTLDCSSIQDVIRLKRVFRYIAGTYNLGIRYRADGSCKLDCYSDADFGGCNKTGRSTSGVVVTYAGGAVSWLSQRQHLTATSTTEAELVAANEAVKEIIWLSRMFEEMGCPKQVPILQIDNQATIRICHNPENHHRTKHIRIKYFFIREKVLEGILKVQYISTENQVADIMTKPLPRPRLENINIKLGLSKIII